MSSWLQGGRIALPVVAEAGGTDDVDVLVGPVSQRLHDLKKAASGVGEGVLDAGRNCRVHRARHNAVSLETAQRGA